MSWIRIGGAAIFAVGLGACAPEPIAPEPQFEKFGSQPVTDGACPDGQRPVQGAGPLQCRPIFPEVRDDPDDEGAPGPEPEVEVEVEAPAL